jgi:uncharacterized protein
MTAFEAQIHQQVPAMLSDDPLRPIYQHLGDDEFAPVSVILKLRGETCDIDCVYCYEKRKQAPGGARVTAEQVDELAGLFPGRPMAVELHGGEPLTAGRDQVRAVLSALARNPRVVRVALQTNGVLLDDAWLDLFDELCPQLQIGISLDGDARGNAWRVGYDGKPAYPRVVSALRLLARRGRAAGVIAAVTPAVLGRAEAVLDHIAAFGSVNAVSFVPCFDQPVNRPTAAPGRVVPPSRRIQAAAVSGGTPAWAVSPAEYADFVIAATAHWIGSGLAGRLKLEPAVSMIRKLQGLGTASCHFSALKCDHVFTFYPDGRLGSCDELPWPRAQLLTLSAASAEQVGEIQLKSPLLVQARDLMRQCTSCDYLKACGGGCTATRLRLSAAGEEGYCGHRMRLADATAALLADPWHPDGAWCLTARWRPREPNTMRDVLAFTARWDDPDAERPAAQLLVSDAGNINRDGLPGIREADDLDPRHPQWRDAIEPGVWPVVDAVTSGWELITYDSCQGHRSAPGGRASGLRVGILPRGRSEYSHAAAALCRAVRAVISELPGTTRIAVGRCELRCQASGALFPVLDLTLEPAVQGGWEGFFRDLGAATSLVVAALLAQSPRDGSPCGCPKATAGCPRPQP